MSAMQRSKGQRGEREVADLVRAATGLSVSRNWTEQFFGGACDLNGIPGWAVEVKRAKTANVTAWWEQATAQAIQAGALPALVYRIDGFGKGRPAVEKWKVVIPAHVLIPCADTHATIEMTLSTWAHILKGTYAATTA